MEAHHFKGYPSLLFYDEYHRLKQDKEGLISEREMKVLNTIIFQID